MNTESTLQEKIRDLLESKDLAQLEYVLEAMHGDELNRLFAALSPHDRLDLLGSLPPALAADVLHVLPFVQATELVEELPLEEAVSIIDEMPAQDQADFVGELDEEQAEAILSGMDAEDAEQVRSLVRYDDFCAGGLMDAEFVAFPLHLSVAEVITLLRANAEKYADYQIQYAYVTDRLSRLVGVLRLRDLLLAPNDVLIDQIMIPKPLSLPASEPLDKLREFFQEHNFLGVPVVGIKGELVGVLNRNSVEEALGERSTDDYLKSQGLIREELRSMPLWTRSKRRLMWLSLNIVLNFFAASVISFYQDTLAQVIALAMFLPVISDMSGCSGNQAVAVSMRELSLGLIKSGDIFRVFLKEIWVGIINGLLLGTLISLIAMLWHSNVMLGIVVGLALMINTVIAVSLGGVLPLIMRRFHFDPALASGPLLTTATDLCGFLIALSLTARFLT